MAHKALKKNRETMKKNILFVVAHTDDETLGAGATIKKHALNGHTIKAISMTNGVGSRGGNINAVSSRLEASTNASKILGFEWLENFDFPDNALDGVNLLELVQTLEKALKHFKPDLVYTHSAGDLNIDHSIVCRAVLTVFRPIPQKKHTEIRTFEVPSATDFGHPDVTGEFHPNLFIDISDCWKFKEKALQAYEVEMKQPPHTRSIKNLQNLAEMRGNQVGLHMA